MKFGNNFLIEQIFITNRIHLELYQMRKNHLERKLEVCLFSSLETLRNEIKQIDDNIVHMIANRIDIVRDIGKLKLQLDLPIINQNVEEANLKRLTDLAKDKNISPDLIHTIYLLLKNYAVQIQERDQHSINIHFESTLNPNRIISKESGLTMGGEST